jgi:hypothetical protein
VVVVQIECRVEMLSKIGSRVEDDCREVVSVDTTNGCYPW